MNGVQTWYDSPVFGVGADTLVFTTNQYSFTYGTFEGVILNAGGKAQLENNAASCPWFGWYVFGPTPLDGTTFSLMPAQHYTSPSSFSGTTNPVYVISTHGLSGETSSTVYRVWRVRNVVSGAASLDEIDVSVAHRTQRRRVLLRLVVARSMKVTRAFGRLLVSATPSGRRTRPPAASTAPTKGASACSCSMWGKTGVAILLPRWVNRRLSSLGQ